MTWSKRRCKRYAAMVDRVRAAERFRAHVWNRAHPRGRIHRPWACPICKYEPTSESNLVQAHHPDYRKPFKVVWCCTSCHRRIEAGTLRPKPWHIFDYTSLVRVHPHRWKKGDRGPQTRSIVGRRRREEVPF